MVNVPHENSTDDDATDAFADAAAANSTTDCAFVNSDKEMTSVTTKDPDPVDYPATDIDPASSEAPLTVPIPQVIVVQTTPPAAAIAIVAPTARPVAPTVPLTKPIILTTSNGHSNSNPVQHNLAGPNKPYNNPSLHQSQQSAPTIMNHVGPPPTIQQHAPQATTPIYVTATRQYVTAPQIIGGHHHQHVHTIGQLPHGQWPVVDPVFHFGPGFEHQHYCPTHSQGPQPNEHVVFFHVNVGVSVTFLIGGNQEIIRGE